MSREEPSQQCTLQSRVLGTPGKATSQLYLGLSPAADTPLSGTGPLGSQGCSVMSIPACVWSLQHQLLLQCYVHHSCNWKGAAAASQATVPPSWGWGSAGNQESMTERPFPLPSAHSAFWRESTAPAPTGVAHPAASPWPQGLKPAGSWAPLGSCCPPNVFARSGKKQHVAFTHRPCFPGSLFRKNRPSESNRMDESHLSPGGGQTTHVHPALSALLLALNAWMNSFSSKMLQFVSGQCYWQDQDQVRTRVGEKPRQDMEDGE